MDSILIPIALVAISILLLHLPHLYEVHLARKALHEALSSDELDKSMREQIQTMLERKKHRDNMRWIKENVEVLPADVATSATRTIRMNSFNKLWIWCLIVLLILIGLVFQ